MNCFRPKTLDRPMTLDSNKSLSEPTNTVKHEVLLRLPNCRVHLVGSGDAVEIAKGDFSLVTLLEDGVAIATIIKVGDDLQWPLTRDEPVVKLDSCNYLFSLPMKLNYGVSFLSEIDLGQLDGFLEKNSCFSCSHSSAKATGVINWKDYAPNVDDYNNALAKAIARGTGQVVKGIFICSNGYTRKVQKGVQENLGQPVNNGSVGGSEKTKTGNRAINENLKRVRNLSKKTEKISKSMLDGVGIVSGSAMAPVIRSGPGKKLLNMVPGQILLASLDAVNQIMNAAEVAEKQALTATSAATTRMVSQRFGKKAGEATGDVLATAGHCVNTAWNILKIRKAIINPVTSASSRGSILKNAQKINKMRKRNKS